MKVLTNKHKLAFGCTMFASSCINNLFVTYYLEYFVTIVRVSPMWFYAGQIVFMIWNATNDPLFGWISDKWRSDQGWDRTSAIRYGGFFWALAFIATWIEWGDGLLSGLHFVVMLCLYDGLLTYVEVNHSALLADITSDQSQRTSLLQWSAICATIGSLSSLAARAFWNPQHLMAFRKVVITVAFFSCVAFEYTARQLRNCSVVAVSKMDDEDALLEVKENSKNFPRMMDFIKELASHHNFTIFLDRLVGDGMTASSQGMVVTFSFALPHLVAVGATTLVQKWGLHGALKFVLQVRFAVALSALVSLTTAFSWWSACVFILANRVVSECVCRLFPLVQSDLTDEDIFLNQRGHGMSASIIGSANLFSKPGQSLAPMLGVYLLSDSLMPAEGKPHMFEGHNQDVMTRLHICKMVVLVPLLCTTMEWLLWRKYNLHGKYLAEVKSYLEGCV